MKVKVCGLTVTDHVEDAAQLGADFGGFVLAPGGPRSLDEDHAALLVPRAEERGMQTVGVFLDDPADRVRRLQDSLGLSVLQLHGSESPETVAALVSEGRRVWKALIMDPTFDSDRARAYWDAGAEVVLLDGWHPELPGGTGNLANWDVAADLASRGPVILAGGLSGDNVAEAIERVQPWGVDASSGLEKMPGWKDRIRVVAYIEAARQAAKGLGA